MIVLPHTSNWDFPLGILARTILEEDMSFVAKSGLFWPPLGWLLKWLGGIPINRRKSQNLVDLVAREYEKRDQLTIVITPEGTRKKVEKLKTGFYHIAKKAKIPILPVFFDYGRKEVIISDLLYPSDDEESDFAIIKNKTKGVKGKNPELGF